jgi:hypothetical protein
MDRKDLNEPLGSATEAIVDTTVNDANKSDDQPTEVTKEVKTETDDVTVTESVTEAPADGGES